MDIDLNSLIYPLFVKEGKYLREEIPSMPGVFRVSPDMLLDEALYLQGLGIKHILLFGVPEEKDWDGQLAYADKNIISRAVVLLKKSFPEIIVITDVCLCAYTSHGHCGILKDEKLGINNKATLDSLSRMALSHARAGADYVAPSAMAEGQVKAIRKTLDEFGYEKTKILGYSAKFASNFYGPFRDIAGSSPQFGDRRAYQLDYTDRENALKEIKDDIKEGADIVMVKPGLGYLDVVKDVKHRFKHPLAVYNVSGEYSMVKKGAQEGFWKEKDMVFEIISSIKRAGADFIITYHAKDIARWLDN